MDAAEIQTVFKNIGKLVKLAQIGDDFSSSLKAHLMGLNDQLTDATLDTYPIYQLVVLPTQTAMNRVVTTADAVMTRAKQAIENYLIVLAPDLGVSATDTAAAKLEALKTAMTAASQTVDSSTPDGFYGFINDNWGVALPSDVAPTCPDTWITTSVV